MTSISTGGGMDVSKLFQNAFDKVDQAAKTLNEQMDKINASDPQAMLKMQFMVGNYNAMLESASSVTKSLVDETKQMAQRSG